MSKKNVIKWTIVALVVLFWMVTSAVFGNANTRGGLRVLVLLILLLALAMYFFDKLIVAFRVDHPAQNAKKAYHAIVDRFDDGKLNDGYVVGLLIEGTKGYTPQPDLGKFSNYKDAQNLAQNLNKQLGLSEGQANRIVSRWS
jgi:hypothetical protein